MERKSRFTQWLRRPSATDGDSGTGAVADGRP